MKTTDELTKMGRRRFLESLSAIGLSGTALGHMDKETLESLTDDPSSEVPRVEALVHTNHEEVVAGNEKPKREPVYYTIPRDEWIAVETANHAARKLDQKLARVVDSNLVRVGVTEVTDGFQSKHAVVVRRDKLADRDTEPSITATELRNHIPASMTGSVGSGDAAEVREGIPVVFEERELELTGCSLYNIDWSYDYNYSSVPAGSMITGSKNGEKKPGTVCTPAYYDGNNVSEFVLLTCSHIFGADGEGKTAWQPCPNSTVGTCFKSDFRWNDEDSSDRDSSADRAFDWAVVRVDSNHDTSYKFAAQGGGTRRSEVAGIVGWDKIKDGGAMNKQGARTEYKSGSVDTWFTNQTFETTADGGGGDSGGPNYRQTYYADGTSFEAIGGTTSYGTSSGTGVIWSGKAEAEWPISI